MNAWFAPGRVNLIGEHTDYNAGLAMPFALAQGTTCTVGATPDRGWIITSSRRPDERVIASQDTAPSGEWSDYVIGALKTVPDLPPDLDVHLESNVPEGAGLSSSASLCVAVVAAACDYAGVALPARQLALRAQQAENSFVGVPCGALDQLASACSTEGHATVIDFRSGEMQHVPIPGNPTDPQLWVIDTGAAHRLAAGPYAARRQECAEAARALGLPNLRDVPLEETLRLADPLRRRAQHVISETWRVETAVDLITSGRIDDIGPLLTACHTSLREDFEVSTEHLNVTAEAAIDAGALGARMIGGGFGGSVLALTRRPDILSDHIAAAFRRRRWEAPQIFEVRPSRGAHRLL